MAFDFKKGKQQFLRKQYTIKSLIQNIILDVTSCMNVLDNSK